ncbi:MAG: hypothetical protein JW900_09695 [Anaerolineae bacterium]|nr:hypothetical protein [Anaerolineae bacterium]
MRIGKLVKSNSHVDYVCQVYGPGEVEKPPAPAAYALGAFVRVPLEGGGNLVGLVHDTVLLNPDFGSLGPRLSPAPDLAVFSPDYLAEQATLVGIIAVGMIDPGGAVTQGLPPLAAQIDSLVERMDDDAVRAFHRAPDGGVRLEYAPLLLALGGPLARHLLLRLVDRLAALFPDQAAPLAVLRGELAWQAVVGPVGGGS